MNVISAGDYSVINAFYQYRLPFIDLVPIIWYWFLNFLFRDGASKKCMVAFK